MGRNDNIITYQGHNTLVLGSKEGRHKNREIFAFDMFLTDEDFVGIFLLEHFFWFYFFFYQCQTDLSQVSTLSDRGELFLLEQFLGSTSFVGSLKSIFKPIFLKVPTLSDRG